MRVRLIRPSYWTDSDLHIRLTADQREFYIGLWMLADDAGYIAWDLDRVGAELYPYRSPSWRRTHLPKWLATLSTHVRVLACGKHVVIPSLPRHQSPPKPSYQNQRSHDRCVYQVVPEGATGDQRAPAQEGGSSGVLLEGGGRGATGLTSIEETTSEFAAKFAAVGGTKP
jgi:hypothetical protein